MRELLHIQSKIKCPKNRKNEFGGFRYRNCEDIYDAVKPLLEENNCMLSVSDQIAMFGDRVYVKATAKITNSEGVSVECQSYAREPLAKKGMDESQVTGASSSYARKQALGGLLLLDDTDDADAIDNRDAKTKQYAPSREKINSDQLSTIRDFLSMSKKITEASFCKASKIAKLEDLEAARYEGAVKYLNTTIGAENADS